MALDGPDPDSESIHGVILTDISREGLMAADAGHLVPGASVLLEVPLVGWREAEVRWIAGNRAGCRFTLALSLDELRLAAASSARLADECPALVEAIARIEPVEGASIAPEPLHAQVRPASWSSILLLLAVLAATGYFMAVWFLDRLG